MKRLTHQELIDIVNGAAIYGTGGGGSLTVGLQLMDEAVEAGYEFKLVDFDELADDDLIGTPYSCGAISPLTEEERKKYARLPDYEKEHYNMALEQMERFMGKPVKACISTELGGGNTAKAMYVAATTGKFIMDADPAGRSVPALQHSTYCIHGVPMCPISVMNRFGEGAIITHVFDDERAEDLVRALAVVSQNTVAVVDHVNTAEVLKNAVIRGAISHSEAIGKAFLTAKEKGEDFVSAVIEAGKGKPMFNGVVTKSSFETRDGFTFGDTVIAGTGEYEGHTLHIWYQNENIISWLDDKFFVTVPDLICVFDLDEKMPQLNPYAREGENVSVICLPAPAEWTTQRGLEVFGPRSFGYDVDYVPFC